MSNPSGIKQPNIFQKSQTGTKPKSKLAKLASSKFSPKKQQHTTIPIINEIPTVNNQVTNLLNQHPDRSFIKSPKLPSSPRRNTQSEDLQKQLNRSTPSPKRSPRHHQETSRLVSFEEDFNQDNMGLAYGPVSMTYNDEPTMSFVEFESLYNMEKELGQARIDTIAELDDKCIFGGWFGTRRGVYTELPDPCRNFEWMKIPSVSIITPNNQLPTEGFSFAPGWSINAEHFYQWQQKGKNILQVSC